MEDSIYSTVSMHSVAQTFIIYYSVTSINQRCCVITHKRHHSITEGLSTS